MSLLLVKRLKELGGGGGGEMWGNVTVLSGPLWEGKEVTRNWSWSGQFSPGTESRQVRERYHLNNRCLTVSVSPPVGVTTFSINEQWMVLLCFKTFQVLKYFIKIFTKNIYFFNNEWKYRRELSERRPDVGVLYSLYSLSGPVCIVQLDWWAGRGSAKYQTMLRLR